MAGILFDSQRVLPNVAESMGFRFRFPQLPGALADLLKQPGV
jgi:NAD dependent epimerase/dehydratase family enzyme